MREQFAAFSAAFAVYRRRRGTFVLLIILIATIGVTVWGSYSILREQRRNLARIEKGQLGLVVGYECDPQGCRMSLPTGEPFGPVLDPSSIQGNGNAPPDPQAQQQVLASLKPQIVASFNRFITSLAREYAPKRIFLARARSLGSLWGIIFVTFLGATLFGAEWRLSTWRTLLTHEPRRGRVLLGKFAALWLLVAIAFVVTLGLASAADSIFRVMYHVDAGGGHGLGPISLGAGRALLGLEFFATLAAMFATLVRSSLAGLGAPLAFALLDGLATRRFIWLRHFLPAQQVTALLPHRGVYVDVSAPWWPRISYTLRCGPLAGDCRAINLRPIPPGRAAAVLGAWLVAALLAAYAMLRARDVPQ
jgi:ABC-type transport system involved in multi-copper enzyme maturation permease subunit